MGHEAAPRMTPLQSIQRVMSSKRKHVAKFDAILLQWFQVVEENKKFVVSHQLTQTL
jgi:predicted RNase H-like nuclease